MEKEIDNFKFIDTLIDGVFEIEVKKHADSRGYFMETYKKEDFEKAGITCEFVQDNESKSSYGVLRGLHFQKKFPQAKLVRCLDGEVFDVCVDLRKNSPTYGKYVSTILSSSRGNQLFIPGGFAHGFLVLSETATFAYKCDDIYHPNDEGGLMYNDPDIGIVWPKVTNLLLSEKDKNHGFLKDHKVDFE